MSKGFQEDNKIIRFDLLKINRDSQRLCKCSVPSLELDTVNRIVKCLKCSALLDPIDALSRVAEHVERYEVFQSEAKKQAERWYSLAQESINKHSRSKAFREMESSYKKGLYPVCPECSNLFDPAEIIRWTRR